VIPKSVNAEAVGGHAGSRLDLPAFSVDHLGPHEDLALFPDHVPGDPVDQPKPVDLEIRLIGYRDQRRVDLKVACVEARTA